MKTIFFYSVGIHAFLIAAALLVGLILPDATLLMFCVLVMDFPFTIVFAHAAEYLVTQPFGHISKGDYLYVNSTTLGMHLVFGSVWWTVLFASLRMVRDVFERKLRRE